MAKEQKKLYRYIYKPIEETIAHSLGKFKYKDSETKEKRQIEYDFLNKKQYKEFLKSVDAKNKELAEDEQPITVDTVGYTKIKKAKKNKDALLGIQEVDFDVKKKKSFMQRVSGYIQTTEDNYVAIVKTKILPIILMLCVVAGVGAAGFAVRSSNPDIKPFNPIIDDDINQQVDKNPDNAEENGIRIQGFSKWTIPANTSTHIAVPLSNPSTNPCYFTFEIVLDDTGETLYKSKMVPPGNAIKYVDFTRALPAGEYNMTIYIYTNALETGEGMNSAKLQVEATAQ